MVGKKKPKKTKEEIEEEFRAVEEYIETAELDDYKKLGKAYVDVVKQAMEAMTGESFTLEFNLN